MPISRFEKTLYAAIAILGVIMFASLSIVVNTTNADVHLFFFDCFIALVAMAFFLLCFKIAKAVLVPSEPETTIGETAEGKDENTRFQFTLELRRCDSIKGRIVRLVHIF